jgi:hypothetical protein
MMRPLRHPWLLLVLTLGCGAKDETTAVDTDTTAGSSTGTTTAQATAAETAEPTTADTTAASTGSSTGSPTTGDAPACETSADDCGVMVTDVGSFCPDTPPTMDELRLEALGPGKLRITEVGRDSACNIQFGTNVSFGQDRLIIVTYEIMGQPDGDCICEFEVTTTLNNLASGTWEVLVGALSGKVDVP